MTTLNILSGGAAQGLVASLAPDFKALTGLEIAGEFGAVGAMAEKLRNGTAADIVILTAKIIADLAGESRVVGASISDIVWLSTGRRQLVIWRQIRSGTVGSTTCSHASTAAEAGVPVFSVEDAVATLPWESSAAAAWAGAPVTTSARLATRAVTRIRMRERRLRP